VPWLVAGGVVVLSGGVWFALSGMGPGSAQTAAMSTMSPTASSSAAPMQARADAVASELTSGDPALVADALAMPTGQVLDAAVVKKLAALDVTIDASTWVLLDARTATASAVITGSGQAAKWTMYLAQVDAVWKITATVPQAPS